MDTQLPLDDLRVVELGQLLAGPFCGQLLGDFGAEVIKVEDPGQGDPMRQWGREKPHGKSLWWPVVARNKKSVTCNLRTPEGQELLRRLLAAGRRAGRELPAGHAGALGARPRAAVARPTPAWSSPGSPASGRPGRTPPRAGFGSIGEAMGGIRYVMGDPGPAARPGRHLARRLARGHLRLPGHPGGAAPAASAPAAARSSTPRSTRPCWR